MQNTNDTQQFDKDWAWEWELETGEAGVALRTGKLEYGKSDDLDRGGSQRTSDGWKVAEGRARIAKINRPQTGIVSIKSFRCQSYKKGFKKN